MAGGPCAAEAMAAAHDPDEAPSEVGPAACQSSPKPEKACTPPGPAGQRTPCTRGGMAEGLFPGEALLHAARIAPSTIDETPTSAVSPLGEAKHGTDASTEAPMPLPASKGPHRGTPGPQPPAPPEAALSPSRTSWTAFVG